MWEAKHREFPLDRHNRVLIYHLTNDVTPEPPCKNCIDDAATLFWIKIVGLRAFRLTVAMHHVQYGDEKLMGILLLISM